MWQGISLKSERNNPGFKPLFNILLHTQSIVCATVLGQCLEYLGYITLGSGSNQVILRDDWSPKKIVTSGCVPVERICW